jgi:hypothetical protein
LDLLKIVSAMLIASVTSRFVVEEGSTRETRWAVMHFDLLTVVTTMVLERIIARSLDKGEEG